MSDKISRERGSAVRVAGELRDRIIRGDLPPGQPLREVAAADEFGVARTTLREAFRLLAADGLVEAVFNRGTLVKTLTAADVRDIYIARRTLEMQAAEESVLADQEALDALGDAIETVRQAEAAGDWRGVGTASLGFHETIVALLGSPLLDEFFRNIVARLRLAFGNAGDDEAFHRPWLPTDVEICAMLRSGRRAEAAAELRAYLDGSERAVLDRMRMAGLLDEPASRRGDAQ